MNLRALFPGRSDWAANPRVSSVIMATKVLGLAGSKPRLGFVT